MIRFTIVAPFILAAPFTARGASAGSGRQETEPLPCALILLSPQCAGDLQPFEMPD